MSEELAIEILKQATLETTVGACEKCPRKDKNKTCIGCLDTAREKVLEQLQQKENIIEEVREYIKPTGQYLEDIKRFKVDVLEPNYLDILEILDKEKE